MLLFNYILTKDFLFLYPFPKLFYTILARKQSGVGANCDNVASKNVGNIDESIKNLDETLFSCLSGQINEESYVREALDTYSDANNFSSPENKGIDFSKFKK